MVFFEKIKNILLNAGLSREEYEGLQPEVCKSNRQNLRVFSLVIVVYLGALMILSTVNSVAEMNFWYYFAELMVCLVLFIVSNFFVKKNYFAVMSLVYFFMISLLVFSILIGTITSYDSKSTIYPVLLFVIPFLFMDRPAKFDFLLTLSVILFVILGLFFKDTDVFHADLLNVLILYLASMVVSTQIIRMRFKGLNNEKRLSFLNDYDSLTETYNRNCYERRKVEYQNDSHNSCQVIFFDVNGLHEVNNTYGHVKGDEMLCFVAKSIKDIFGSQGCYRIGGDEFLVLNTNHFDEHIEMKIQQFRHAIEKEGYHTSLGYAYSMEHVDDLTALTKKAEAIMYEEKREYYQKNNIQRDIRR
jgi:diguanylate cyclase (GGDEF)-like protein